MSEEITTDALGRRGGARQRRSIEEKRRIVGETLFPGTPVALISRKHELNANLVLGWRRLYQQGLLEVRDGGVKMALLPRSSHAKPTPPVPGKRGTTESIEIRFPNGSQINLPGSVHANSMSHLIELLVRT